MNEIEQLKREVYNRTHDSCAQEAMGPRISPTDLPIDMIVEEIRLQELWNAARSLKEDVNRFSYRFNYINERLDRIEKILVELQETKQDKTDPAEDTDPKLDS